MKRFAGVFATLIAVLVTATPARADITLAVNEGVTYYVTPTEIREKYKELSELLGKQLKTTVRVVPVDQYPVLRKGLDEQEYELAFVHPAHHSLMSIRDGKYKLVVLTKGYTDYRARFFVAKDTHLKEPGDMKGKRFGMPDPDSITAVIDERIQTTAFNAEQALTKDTVPVNVDAVIFWHVRDAQSAALSITNYREAINQVAPGVEDRECLRAQQPLGDAEVAEINIPGADVKG